MTGAAGLITHPIALCAYVLSLVFGLLAKMWNSKAGKNFNRQLFRLAIFVSVTALVGGLALAWYQTSRTPSSVAEPAAKSSAPGSSPAGTAASQPSVTQTTSGIQAPNAQNSGSGTINVQYGNPPNPPPKTTEKKK
ncbi:MAG TPA: hypothetical protein VEI26_16420 [Terriglobales bacterium]|nr:hypothetical protein [Terriglobales bacterium]